MVASEKQRQRFSKLPDMTTMLVASYPNVRLLDKIQDVDMIMTIATPS